MDGSGNLAALHSIGGVSRVGRHPQTPQGRAWHGVSDWAELEDLEDNLIPTPCHGQGHLPLDQLAHAPVLCFPCFWSYCQYMDYM